MEQTDSLNVALIGYGYAGKTFHAPLITCTPNLTLSMIVSSDRQKVAKDLPKVLVAHDAADAFASKDIDLVVIATPNDTHFDLVHRALEAGKHVIVDKPFTTTATEARDLIRTAQTKDRVLSVFHNRRWDSDFLTIQRLLNDGTLGEIVHFESHFDRYRPVVQQRWRERPAAGGGLWFDLGPHLLDQSLKLFGEPDAIFGDLAVQRDGATAVDFFHVILRYEKMRVILHASALVAAEVPRFTVHGSLGSFIKFGLDVQEDALKRGELPNHKDWGHDHQSATLTTWIDGFQRSEPVALSPGSYITYYRAVADAIRLGTPNPVTAEEALRVMELIELVEASSTARKEFSCKSVGT